MDIAKITDFLSYDPMVDADPREVVESILQRLWYFTNTQKKAIWKAYEFAKMHHTDAIRLSWEPYIIHPVRVTEFLIPLHPDAATVQASLMHDLIEDTIVETQDIIDNFGEEVAQLCEWLVKVSTVRWRWEERQLETLKKTFLAMGKDLRVIFIKIADRVHNIQTLHYHPKIEKRKRIALETLKVYVPIAKRLWLYVLQWYLENGSFAQLEPTEYKRIAQYVNQHYSWWENYRNIWIQRLEWICAEENIECDIIIWRLKSPYRIRKKLQKYQSRDISKIMDVLAFRVITDKVSDCYMILGMIHKHYTPIFAKMKDYIAIPKPNGYKSLHTTVLGMFDFPVEIQVRTKKMDEVANYGIAAHFAYSDDDAPTSPTVSDQQAEWIQRLQEIVIKFKNSTNKEGFKDELNIELLHQTIFVYTPKWDIIELPLESTVLDFAFRVHTDVWLRFKNAHINGKIVPIDYKLKTWDIVSISTFKTKMTANPGWSRYLRTPWAKNKLQRYIRQQEKDIIFKRVEEKINTKLKQYDLPLLHSKSDKITKHYKDTAYEGLLYQVYDGQHRITKTLRELYPDEAKIKDIYIIDKKQETIELISSSNNTVAVDGHIISNYDFCPECTPNDSQFIIAKSGKWWVKIHALSCTALQTIEPKRFLEAHRAGHVSQRYRIHFTVTASHKPWALLQLLRIVERFGLGIQSLISSDRDDEGRSTITFTIEFENPGTIGYLIDDILERCYFHEVLFCFEWRDCADIEPEEDEQ